MTLIENDLLQIITIFNYTQLILIFTSSRHFTKRFERVNKLDGCFYKNVIQTLKTTSERSSH